LCLTKIPDAARFNLSSWRIAYCGSERVSGDTMTAFQESFSCAGFSSRAFFPCYGLAEATLFVCGTHCCRSISLPSGTESYVRVGELQKDSSIVVVEPISEHRIQADRVVGEIWMKSPSVAPGYYQDEDQTGSTFERTCAAGNGYLRTGDLGFTHDGGLYFVSRLKNLMKVRGRSFFAEDIETHVARVGAPIGIKRCVAFSIERNSGEAMIILMEGDENINSNAAIATVRSSMCDTFDLDPYAIKIAPKNSLPLTTSGKLQRSICRNQFIEGLYD
jgi:acyl-CoA synthetase (AMP-forming)/AMP-acid ligase II